MAAFQGHCPGDVFSPFDTNWLNECVLLLPQSLDAVPGLKTGLGLSVGRGMGGGSGLLGGGWGWGCTCGGSGLLGGITGFLAGKNGLLAMLLLLLLPDGIVITLYDGWLYVGRGGCCCG